MSRMMLKIAPAFAGLLLGLALPLSAWSQPPIPFEIVQNGDFSLGCEGWTFTDESFPELPGLEPYATLDCGVLRADVHHVSSYSFGVLSQSFPDRFCPVDLSFDYEGLETACSAFRGILYREDTEILRVYFQQNQFDFFEVWVLGVPVIQLSGITPYAGHVRVAIEVVKPDRDIVLYLNGEEVGRARYPGSIELKCDRLDLFTSTSCYWSDGHVLYDNVSLMVLAPEWPSPTEAGTWGSLKCLYR